MSDLVQDMEAMASRLKHFGISGDASLGVGEIDANEMRALLRRSQNRIELLESILTESTVPGSSVVNILQNLD